MFRIPPEGIYPSVTKHNCDYNLVSDWIEGCLLFGKDSKLSKSDVVDILTEEGIYRKQDFADEFICDCWNRIEKRHNDFGTKNIFEISPKRIIRIKPWEEYSAYSFFLAISLKTYYKIKISSPSNFINQQGETFEEISIESLRLLFPEWFVMHIGRTQNNTTKFDQLLKNISDNLKVSIRNTAIQHYSTHQNEAKLDILMARRFFDGYCNIPIVLIQCASGENWKGKRQEPNVETWNAFLDLNSYPMKGLAIPFSLDTKQFIEHSTYIKGILLDRMRLLSVTSKTPKFLNDILAKKAINITKKILKNIPKAN